MHTVRLLRPQPSCKEDGASNNILCLSKSQAEGKVKQLFGQPPSFKTDGMSSPVVQTRLRLSRSLGELRGFSRDRGICIFAKGDGRAALPWI